MSKRAALYMAGLVLATASCGGGEKKVVDNYFNALKAGDNQTVSSFAAVSFSEPVDSWKVTGTREEPKAESTLPQLTANLKKLEADLAANKRGYGAYHAQRWQEIQKLNEIRKKNAAGPAALSSVAAEHDKYQQQDKDLKRQIALAKAELEKERRAVQLSVGDQTDLDQMKGEVETRQVDVEITSKGQARPYLMTLRRYNLKREQGPRVMSRWVVQDLKPKS
jgi:hypothetical protein